MLKEAGRIIRPGGHLILCSETVTKKFWNTFEHTRPYPPAAVIKLLNENGKGELGGLNEFRYAGVFYLGDYHRNRLLYFLSALLGYYTPWMRREYFLVLERVS
jgi:hypothetical protein